MSCSGNWTRYKAARLTPKDVALLYDGTLEGLLSAIFYAFEQHAFVARIATVRDYQEDLLLQTETIPCDEVLALRVSRSIVSSFGRDEFERILTASRSDDADRGTTIYRYLVYAYDRGPGCWHDLTVPEVDAFERLWTDVYNERHKILQFTRFSKMDGGIYFAQINPKANVVPLIMEHFSKRFNVQPFLIFDEVHHIAGMWDMQQISYVITDDLTPPQLDEHEHDYQVMWKLFYDRICNERRYNPALRRQFMPQRLWRNITEMDGRLAEMGETELIARRETHLVQQSGTSPRLIR